MLGIIVAALGLLAALPQPAPAVGVPMQVINNHVIVKVTLNGAGPFHFVVDSGAGNLIDPAVAAAIGARVRGHVRLVGVGGTRENGALTTVHRVDIGTATFADQRFVVAAARSTFAAAEGPIVDGLIGRGIIGSGVTVFDYAHRTLTFRAAGDAVSRDGATVLAVSMVDGEPHVPCVVGSIEGSCAIDTGSRLNITVLAPFAKQHPEVLPPSVSATGVDGYGIGGAAYGRFGRLERVSFGPLTLRGIVADFSVQQRGAFASERTAANVGGGLLRRFTLAFDLPHGRVGLRPNDEFDAPDAIDRSGLFLIARDNAIAVLDVRPRTPADRAGIVPGDRILGAEGQAFAPETLPALRALLE